MQTRHAGVVPLRRGGQLSRQVFGLAQHGLQAADVAVQRCNMGARLAARVLGQQRNAAVLL